MNGESTDSPAPGPNLSPAALALGRLLAFMAPKPIERRLFDSPEAAPILRDAIALAASEGGIGKTELAFIPEDDNT